VGKKKGVKKGAKPYGRGGGTEARKVSCFIGAKEGLEE